jgi:hypothetical protein
MDWLPGTLSVVQGRGGEAWLLFDAFERTFLPFSR